ncbi:MAG: type II toxin-antitoxin system HicA family toxin [Gaiellaceae bacterium MAG52_C11]|nr:type II toxin-antitoxin system HicA family toxin [Candidatus Gaiellasilicea maunaloa]
MKVWQIIGLVEADGWQLARTRGSHRQYKHLDKPGTVTIAASDPMTCFRRPLRASLGRQD